MKGKFFGYKQESPCPSCGTSRVGHDYDDDYYVSPGILHPATEPTCKFTGWESGVEYQRGTLFGYEVREYLLAKYGHDCQYCHGKSKDPVLELDHIVPGSRGGSDRVSNLTIACHTCNQDKDNRTAEEYGYPEVQSAAKKPLKDAAALNSTRWYIWGKIKKLIAKPEMGTGGRTKYNRTMQHLPKTHYYDAACVGASTPILKNTYLRPLIIRAVGRGNRQMVRVDRYGFPKGYRHRQKLQFGFQTGDMVKATVLKGTYEGSYVGIVAIRSSGYFDIKDVKGKVIAQGIPHRYLKLIQRADGYAYLV